MRYLEIDTAKKISKIGLGTWQFGSPEWVQQSRAVIAYSPLAQGAAVRRAR